MNTYKLSMQLNDPLRTFQRTMCVISKFDVNVTNMEFSVLTLGGSSLCTLIVNADETILNRLIKQLKKLVDLITINFQLT